MKKIIFGLGFCRRPGRGISRRRPRLNSNVKNFLDRREIGDPDGCYGCTPPWGFYRNRLSCGEAKARVRHSGYRNVATIECRGSTYTFEATRKGRDVDGLRERPHRRHLAALDRISSPDLLSVLPAPRLW